MTENSFNGNSCIDHKLDGSFYKTSESLMKTILNSWFGSTHYINDINISLLKQKKYKNECFYTGNLKSLSSFNNLLFLHENSDSLKLINKPITLK